MNKVFLLIGFVVLCIVFIMTYIILKSYISNQSVSETTTANPVPVSTNTVNPVITPNIPSNTNTTVNTTTVSNSEPKTDTSSNSKTSIIYFYASWCGYCTRFTSTWNSLVTKFKHNYQMIAVDIDKNKHLKSDYGVTSTPTIYKTVNSTRQKFTSKRNYNNLVEFIQS